MTLGVSNEVVHKGFDGVDAALHRRYGVASSLWSHTLSHDSAEVLTGGKRCTAISLSISTPFSTMFVFMFSILF